MYIWRKRAGPRWLQIWADDLARRFGGALAITERPGSKRASIEIACKNAEQARELVRQFGGSASKLRTDWLEHLNRQAKTKPLRIGTRLVVLTAATRKRSLARTLVIPAEAAFGTGHHATTAMCVRMLERLTRGLPTGWSLFDAGTGTGILALAGSCFGADRVLAIDNDPLACSTAKRNARANRFRNVEVVTGDVVKHQFTGKFDIITANLFSEILIQALPAWTRRLAPAGRLIFSGILRAQEARVVRALRRHGLAVTEVRRRGKWVAILAGSRPQKGS